MVRKVDVVVNPQRYRVPMPVDRLRREGLGVCYPELSWPKPTIADRPQWTKGSIKGQASPKKSREKISVEEWIGVVNVVRRGSKMLDPLSL